MASACAVTLAVAGLHDLAGKAASSTEHFVCIDIERDLFGRPGAVLPIAPALKIS